MRDRLAYEARKSQPDKLSIYQKVKKLMLEGRVKEAEREAEKLSGGQVSSFSYLADVSLRVHPGSAVSVADFPFERYKRQLELTTGIAMMDFSAPATFNPGAVTTDTWYHREVFSSAVDQVVHV